MMLGGLKKLYIKASGNWVEIGCITDHTLSESLTTRDQRVADDNFGFIQYRPGRLSYSISFSGVVNSTSTITYFSLVTLKRARTLIEWKIESSEDEYYQSGSGYISSINESSPVGDVIVFDGQITGVGAVTATEITPPQYILDTYTNAESAYSLRKLRTGETYAIRVRRSSDNSETDVELESSGSISLSSVVSAGGNLGTWVGSNDAYVVTWYDQSGNNMDATQANTSYQPQIISSGSLVTSNSLPSIYFVANDFLITSVQTTTAQPLTRITVGEFSSFGTVYLQDGVVSTATTRTGIGTDSSGNVRAYAGSVATFNRTFTVNQQFFNATIFNTSSSTTYLDNQAVSNTLNVGTRSYDGTVLGAAAGGSGSYLNGYMSEAIIYMSDATSNISGIRTDINTHYSIY